MSRTPLRCEIEEGVATLTLDNPPLNLVSIDLTALLLDWLAKLADRRDVRVLVITGAGERAFCAGSDVTEFPGLYKAGDAVAKKLGAENAAFSAVDDFPKPTIAALNGLAYGGGPEHLPRPHARSFIRVILVGPRPTVRQRDRSPVRAEALETVSRGDWVVAEAVSSELVSRDDFPVCRENAGKSEQNWPVRSGSGRKLRARTAGYG